MVYCAGIYVPAGLAAFRSDINNTCLPHHLQVRWNLNGTWILSTSKDATVKVWDVRHTKREMHSWQGHARSGARADVFCATWHPIHLELLVSGEMMNVV